MLTFGNKILTRNNEWIGKYVDPWDTIGEDAYTIRFKFEDTSFVPEIPEEQQEYGYTWTQVGEGVWDYHTRFNSMEGSGSPIDTGYFTRTTNIEDFNQTYSVIGASLSKMTYGTRLPVYASGMFCNMNGLKRVSNWPREAALTQNSYTFKDAKNLEYVDYIIVEGDPTSMFKGCTSLKSVNITMTATQFMSAIFDGCSSLESCKITFIGSGNAVGSVYAMFRDCVNLNGQDMLAAYNWLSTHIPANADTSLCFKNCGINTESGMAARQQIPTTWGGDMQV
jgi:hypothetical protein